MFSEIGVLSNTCMPAEHGYPLLLHLDHPWEFKWRIRLSYLSWGAKLELSFDIQRSWRVRAMYARELGGAPGRGRSVLCCSELVGVGATCVGRPPH